MSRSHHAAERDDDALDQIGADAARWVAAHAPTMQSIVASEGRTIEVMPDCSRTVRGSTVDQTSDDALDSRRVSE